MCCFVNATAQKKNYFPTGTIKLTDTLYADKTEVTNVNWREYLYFLSVFDSAAAVKALPDTNAWTRCNGNAYFAAEEYYFRHPSFNNYPVTCISYEQALDYCRWRTWAANFAQYCSRNKIKDWRKHIQDTIPLYYYYRLPAVKEWEYFAAILPNQTDSASFLKVRNDEMPYVLNTELYISFSKKSALGSGRDPAHLHLFPMNVDAIYRGYKLKHITGNVAEMTDVKGIAKGGSFIHTAGEASLKNVQPYNGSVCWLGFRCVAVRYSKPVSYAMIVH